MDVLAFIGVVALWLWILQIGGRNRRSERRLLDRIAELEKRLARIEPGRQPSTVAAERPSAQPAEKAPVAAPSPATGAFPAGAWPTPESQKPAELVPPRAADAQPKATPQITAPAPAARPVAPSTTPPAPVAAPPRSAAPVRPPLFAQAGAAEREHGKSLEEKVGTNWLNKIGVVILVFGIALFLAYQLQHMGPAGKILVGYAVSVSLLGGGVFLERREHYKALARAGIGGGWALTFFVTYAMYHVAATRILDSQLLDLILLLIVATGMVWHSLRYNSQVITALAFALAFSTIEISQVTAYSLAANGVLAVALAVIAYRRRWCEFELLGLLGAYINHFLWLSRVLDAAGGPGHMFPEFFPSAAMLLFYWAVFRVTYVTHKPDNNRQEAILTFTAITNAVALLGLLKYQSVHPEWAFWALLVIGSAEMALAFYGKRRSRSPFIVLSTLSSVMIVAAIPFSYDGANWSLLWVLESEALVIAGLRLRESLFQWLGILAGFAVAWKLFFLDAFPIVSLRLAQYDPSHHYAIALAFGVAAAAFWWNGIAIPLRWAGSASEDLDALALKVTSYLGAAAALTGIYIVASKGVTVVVWAALAIVVGSAADRWKLKDLALQCDAIAVAAVMRVAFVNLQMTDRWPVVSERLATTLFVVAALYVCTRRKSESLLLPVRFIAAAYTWAAAGVLTLLMWYELNPVSTAVAWGMLGLFFFELGRARNWRYVWQQGYALLGISFIRIFFVNLNAGDARHLLNPRIYTIAPLIAAYYLVYSESIRPDEQSREAKIAGNVAAWCGTAASAALLYFEMSADWVMLGWSLLAIFFFALAWLSNRREFIPHALAPVVAAVLRGAFFNLYSAPLRPDTFWGQRLHCVGAGIVVLFLGLFFAFRLRRVSHRDEPLTVSSWSWTTLLSDRPEQITFFAPLVLLVALLGVEMRQGMITVSWCAVGVLAFLFALLVGERSFRLAGLVLLLLGVLKILVIDVWQLQPTDRYVTLIVVGTALLLVSFLYSRYRTAIRRFL